MKKFKLFKKQNVGTGNLKKPNQLMKVGSFKNNDSESSTKVESKSIFSRKLQFSFSFIWGIQVKCLRLFLIILVFKIVWIDKYEKSNSIF
jgi:hypothetical protein